MSKPNGLPVGWAWAAVDDLADVGTGTTPRRDEPRYWDGGSIPWITSSAVNQPSVPEAVEFVTQAAFRDTTLKLYPKGTLILALYGEGKTRGKVSELLIDATINQALAALELTGVAAECRPFLKAFLQANYEALRRQAAGGMQPNLNLGIVKRIQVSVAPLNEQRRIVAKIEELLSDLDAGVAALERARANLKRYRAAVLKAAVEGKLTEQWRAEHPAAEPASRLLERILAARRKKWEVDQLARYAAAGKTPPKDWREKYVEPAGPDAAELPALPDGWCWVTVEQILREPTCNGISVKGSANPPGVAALRLSAMSSSGFDYQDRRYIPIDAAEAAALAICEGDFFVSRGNGSLHLLGRGTLAQPPEEQIVFPDTMIRLRFVKVGVLAKLFSTLWASRVIRKQIEKKGRTTAGIFKVSQRDVEAFCLPLPPSAEQEQIITEVERLLSVVAATEGQIEADLRRAARLRQSILKRAFEGKLVAQDTADEPASALLARIRESREAGRRTPPRPPVSEKKTRRGRKKP